MAMTTMASASAAAPPPQKKQSQDTQAYNVLDKPNSKAYQAFNQGACSDGTAHPKELHVYTYCLLAV